MISYSPIEEEKPVQIQRQVVTPPPVKRETTECNYLLYFFIVGAIILSLRGSDQ